MQIPKGGVAFFDSGIGGLTVLSACEKQLSDFSIQREGHSGYSEIEERPVNPAGRTGEAFGRNFRNEPEGNDPADQSVQGIYCPENAER